MFQIVIISLNYEIKDSLNRLLQEIIKTEFYCNVLLN